MFSAVRSSMSALGAASRSISAHADNIANSRTTARLDEVSVGGGSGSSAPADGVYRPVQVSYSAVANGGVAAIIEAVEPSHRVAFNPNDPKADADGLVAAPNVDLVDELVQVRQDRTLFLANLAVFRTADEMTGALLDRKI